MNFRKFRKIKNSTFGKWARTQTIKDMEHYIWQCMIYGPPQSIIWEILECVSDKNKISRITVKSAARKITCNSYATDNLEVLR